MLSRACCVNARGLVRRSDTSGFIPYRKAKADAPRVKDGLMTAPAQSLSEHGRDETLEGVHLPPPVFAVSLEDATRPTVELTTLSSNHVANQEHESHISPKADASNFFFGEKTPEGYSDINNDIHGIALQASEKPSSPTTVLDVPEEENKNSGSNMGFFRRIWTTLSGGNSDARELEGMKQELKERMWRDPSPFHLKAGDLCSLIDPENFEKLQQMGGIEGLMAGLDTSAEKGLSADPKQNGSSKQYTGSIEDRVRAYGANRLPPRKSKGLLMLMWLALQDKILVLLIIAAIVSFALGLYTDFSPPPEYTPCLNPKPGMDECLAPPVDWVEGVAVLVAVLIVDLVGSLNDWQKERQFRTLDAKKEARNITVLRGGKQCLVDVHDVVVGDIVTLEPGEIVAFDGVMLRSHNVKCDESSATGESDMIQKVTYDEYIREMESGSVKHKSVFVLSGSKVLEGVGEFVVTAVGPLSMNGKLMMSLREEPANTPLQGKLNRLAELIAKLGTAAGFLMFVALMIRFFVRYGRDPHPDSKKYGESFINILIISVIVIVVAVPEGLPLAVTLALAFATRRMSNQNLLVRILGSCETMANATCICTDKTGTLTQNKMNVVAGCVGSDLLYLDSIKLEIENTQVNEETVDLGSLTEHLSPDLRDVITKLICINSTAFIPSDTDKEDHVVSSTIKRPWWARIISRPNKSSSLLNAAKSESGFIGSKTETALLNLVQRLDWGEYDQIRNASEIIQVFPFSSSRKAMGVVTKLDKGYRFYVKGASELLLSKSTSVVLSAQSKELGGIQCKTLDDVTRTEMEKIITHYASQSLRTIGLCYRDFPCWPPQGIALQDSGEVAFEDLDSDLTMLGVAAIEDPLRYGVTEAVRACGRAGVRVKMCTGDNILTASSIGKQCGIYSAGGVSIEGPDFRQLSEADLAELAPHLHILARSSPEDKKTLTDMLKSMGETVAVTGDGTNDGPALKSANVGFSMGIAGSEVAKEASDIILLDDNFSSIVSAIMWGRCVNDAVRKFLQFQITVNIVAVVVTFVTSISNNGESSVLTPVQLLWLNLIMDTLAALALATDPADPKSLERKPDRASMPLITTEMWKQIFIQSAYQIILIFVLYYRGKDILNMHNKVRAIANMDNLDLDTLIFNVFVWCQLFNQVNTRRLDRHLNIFHNIHKNIWFILIMLVEIGCQILIIYVGGATFSVKRIGGRDWGISIVAGLVSWPLGALARLVPTEPVERLLIKLRLAPDPNALPLFSPSRTEASDSLSNWNEPAIGQIAKQIGAFSRIRGGRLRASNLVLKSNAKLMREQDIHPREIMAMVPAFIGTSVGGMWKMEIQEKSHQQQQIKRPASVLFKEGKIRFHPDTPSNHPYLLSLKQQ